jgi:hypothetical protein
MFTGTLQIKGASEDEDRQLLDRSTSLLYVLVWKSYIRRLL